MGYKDKKEKDGQEKPEKKKSVKQKSEKDKKAKARPEKPQSDKKKHEKAHSDNKNGEPKGLRYLGGLLLAKMARGGAASLRSNAEEVNKLNVFPVPDGDTGDNMSMTIESGVDAIENLENDDIADVTDVLSHGMLLGARGNSGVILSQFFAGMAKGLQNSYNADPKQLGQSLEEGVKQAYSTVMSPTEGTILTVARESVEYAVSKITPDSTINTFFRDLVGEMNRSLEHTPELLPALKEAGVVDSGGAGLLYIMDGFNRVLNGEDITFEKKVASLSTPKPDLSGFGPDSEMEFAYCTEMLVQLMHKKCDIDNYDIEALRSFLGSVGDSVVAFQTGSIVKLHVHTFTPERVLAHMRSVGECITVKIENMSLQHTALEAEEKEAASTASQPKAEAPAAPERPKERKRYGVVAVATGDGVASIFRELGADEIIYGGQTQNPSSGDFLAAYDKINAETIFVFPNNGNIFLAASMSSDMYDKAKIRVIPSKGIGMGYVALSTLDFDNTDADAVFNGAVAAMDAVVPGYVSPAIRDADMNGVHITRGDTIGIIGKDIVTSHMDRTTATLALIDKLMEGRYMLTVFLGKDQSGKVTEAMRAHMTSVYPSAELYVLEGGQEIYPYIFVAE